MKTQVMTTGKTLSLDVQIISFLVRKQVKIKESKNKIK